MPEALVKYLDQQAVRAILTEGYRRGVRDGLMLEVAYFYGLRVSELVRLDVASYKRESQRLRIVRAKGSLSGEYPVTDALRPKLDSYLDGRTDKKPALFPGRQGRLSTRQVQLVFDATAAAAGVDLNDGQGIHSLRHSIAVHLLEAEWDITEVQKHLGHKRITSTQIYAQVADRRRSERIKALTGNSKIVTV